MFSYLIYYVVSNIVIIHFLSFPTKNFNSFKSCTHPRICLTLKVSNQFNWIGGIKSINKTLPQRNHGEMSIESKKDTSQMCHAYEQEFGDIQGLPTLPLYFPKH